MKKINNELDFQSISLNKLPFGVLSCDKGGLISKHNKHALTFLGIDADNHNLKGNEFVQLVTHKKLIREVQNCLLKGKKKFVLRPILFNSKYLHIIGLKTLEGILLILLDETEVVTAQHNATQNLILGQESERKRLAKEIHDGLGPLMSTIRLELDSLSKTTNNIKINEKLDNLKNMVAETALEMRQISHNLMPSSLMDFGLITSIQNMCTRINNNKEIQVYFDYNINQKKLNTILELNIYRIVQELINNALKHAFASEIQIQIRVIREKLYLTYEDDGKGVNVSEIKNGLGIENIKTRIKSLNGTFDIDTSEGNGFLVSAIIPLN